MSPTRRGVGEGGMTLIELLVAVVVMSILSVGVLDAISTVSIASSNQRGITDVDAVTLSYTEAIKNHVNFKTTLTAAVSASATSLPVADTSQLSTTSAPLEVLVDGELMTVPVGGVSAGALNGVQRGQRGTTPTSHSQGAALSPVYTPCPTPTQLAPAGFTLPPHVTAVGIATTDGSPAVEYWIPRTGTFGTRSDCLSEFETYCPDYGNPDSGTDTNWADTFQAANLPECDPGLIRVSVTTQGDATTRNSVTLTQTLVRRGDG